MPHIDWEKLFPTKSSAVIFVTYMALFVNQGILVTASQRGQNTYSYNTIGVVMATETLKLIISVCVCLKE